MSADTQPWVEKQVAEWRFCAELGIPMRMTVPADRLVQWSDAMELAMAVPHLRDHLRSVKRALEGVLDQHSEHTSLLEDALDKVNNALQGIIYCDEILGLPPAP